MLVTKNAVFLSIESNVFALLFLKELIKKITNENVFLKITNGNLVPKIYYMVFHVENTNEY